MEDLLPCSSSAKQCSLCSYFSPSLSQHVSHLRLVHSQDPNFFVKCGIEGCSSHFGTFAAFSTHIYRHHRSALGLIQTERVSNTPEFSGEEESESDLQNLDPQFVPDASVFDQGDQDLQPSRTFIHDCQKESNAKFVLGLAEGHRVSDAAVQYVIDGCRKVSAQTAAHIQEVVKNNLSELEVDTSVIEHVHQRIDDCFVDPFDGLGTPYLRDKYFKEHFRYLEPQEKKIGKPYYVEQFSGTKRRKVLRSDTFYYVSLLDTLKLLLTNKEIQSEVTSPHHSSTKLEDFCDGSLFKTHPLFSRDPLALQIIGYYDELEVVNPIGSYVKKHKLGCLFFTLANIRPQFRSTLKAIFVVCVGRYEDISSYGLDAFLEPFVDDLKTLYVDGVTAEIGGKVCTFYGGLLAFLADNLAAHAVGGFKQSSSFALRICRSCMITTDLAQECFLETNCHLRTPEQHEEQCEYLNGPLHSHFSVNFGINRRSILEDVPGFSVATGIPHDIMHDLFEGAVPLELKLLLAHCVESRYFTIPELNSRMERYDFPENRPSLIDPTVIRNPTQTSFRQSASQMITLFREFPLLIGDKVPRNDKHWQSLILLLKICKIALSPTCTHDTIPYMRVLIEEKLITFKSLYPNAKIIPKLHYMVHYPTQIQQYGPLVHSWCMRQEAKLSFIKKASRRGNFKNISKTVFNKHQLWLCYQIESERRLLYPKPEISSSVSNVPLEAEPPHLQVELVKIAHQEAVVHHVKLVNLHSITYKSGMYVLLKYDEMEPKFGKILDIITLDSDKITIIFCVQVYLACGFDSHYDAFIVKSTSKFLYTSFDNLAHHRPLQIRKSFSVSDDLLYISLFCVY